MANDIFETRRHNLRSLQHQWGGPLLLSKKLGYSNASFIVQMTGPNPTREVTERTARKIENSLDLPTGWLDHSNGAPTEEVKSLDAALVSKVARVIAQHADDAKLKLSPEKLGNMVALVYEDSQRNANTIRGEFVKSVIELAK